jgi:hypothetical protein
MSRHATLDALVRARLREWPQRPPGIPQQRNGTWRWLRGRPADEAAASHPFLKYPGSSRMKTLPDGLWLNFGGTPDEPFADIFAVEACASLTNLLDKRSRFAPSTHSLMAVCPVPWLNAPITPTDTTPRWMATGVLRTAPEQKLVLPVRDIRVLYALTAAHYDGFVESQVPHPHEYFVPMEKLTEQDGHQDPNLRALVSRASASANFFEQR